LVKRVFLVSVEKRTMFKSGAQIVVSILAPIVSGEGLGVRLKCLAREHACNTL